MLSKAFLPAPTRSLLEEISRLPDFSRFTLVGGSALAMRIGHRLSEDLDFIWDGEKLNPRYVDAAIQALAKNHVVQSMITPAEERRVKEERGIELRDQRRRYAVDDVKLEMFVHHKREIRLYLRDAEKDLFEGKINVLGLDGIFVTKSVLIGERRRSRDLFDLMVLIRDHGYSIDRLFDAISRHDPIADSSAHKATLIGTMPIDADDEGLAPVEVETSLQDIYAFFRERVEDYEARTVAASVKAWRAEDGLNSSS